METPRRFWPPVKTNLTGYDLINNPGLDKGAAFTEVERDLFGLHGFLPPHVGDLDDQVARRMKMLRAFQPTSNVTLFYANCRTRIRPSFTQCWCVTLKSFCPSSTPRPSARAVSVSVKSGESLGASF
jgi:hypothetical protein